MPSAGELLRSERLKRNRSLAEIARETCISARYLQAIEEDRPSLLPGDFFHRSFIRQYAQVLEFDEREIRRILDAVGPPAEIDPIASFNLPQQIADVEQASKPLAQVPTRVAAILFVLVLGGCSGLYALWNRAQEAADPAMQVVAPPIAKAQAAELPEHSRTPQQNLKRGTTGDPNGISGANDNTLASRSSDSQDLHRQ